ncbi:killer cell lectin-like receptor subfamily E member 1 isoform X2 [Sciurus carolinensis]|uniref:killer cell lectin-like receptor subfamily E member 1 isoform X2 n=1 Tax=Sciurus carolinensis TaxID=30640 RepID=UPI001FB43986|nr:killer cell lectin-like receptor subfamily E member 1 isoform X2 [Sciurus carolinensis]
MNEQPITFTTLNENYQQKHTMEKGGCSPFPWRFLSSALGVVCLLLMVVVIAVAVFTTNSFSERTSPSIQQKGPCYHPCPKNWVWFRCSCYYFSKEQLSWRESQNACLSLNSSLLKINRDEMNLFSLNSFFWVGIYYNEICHQWLWENDSVLPPDMFWVLRPHMQQTCLSYKSKEVYLPEKCEEKQTYICKKHLIYPIMS